MGAASVIAILLFAALTTPAVFLYVHYRVQAREREARLSRRLRIPRHFGPRDLEQTPPGPPLRRLARSLAALPWYGRALSDLLSHIGRRTLSAMVLIFAAVAILIGRWMQPEAALAVALVCGAVPALYQRRLRTRQLKLFAEQLPYLIDLLKSALEAGHTLLRALQVAAQNLPKPIANEVRTMVDQVQLGMDIADALEGMFRRVPIEELSFLIAAVRIQHDVGSSLAEILQHVSDSVRSRQRAEHQLRALTAQSRASAIVVSLLPFIVLGAFTLINPSYAHPLLYKPMGIKLLELAIILDTVAFLMMRRLSRVDY
jgi:tight adherence protein B